MFSLLLALTRCWLNCQVASNLRSYDTMWHHYSRRFYKYYRTYHWYQSTGQKGYCIRADSRFAPTQWEMPLSNAVSHWLGVNLELALCMIQPSWLVLSHDKPQVICKMAAILFPCRYDMLPPPGWHTHPPGTGVPQGSTLWHLPTKKTKHILEPKCQIYWM